MSELRPPTRWLDDDASAPGSFSEAARGFREDEPTARMRQHMWELIEQSVAARVVPRAWRMPWRGISALLLVGTGMMLAVRGPQLEARVSPAAERVELAAQPAAISEPSPVEPLSRIEPAADGGVSVQPKPSAVIGPGVGADDAGSKLAERLALAPAPASTRSLARAKPSVKPTKPTPPVAATTVAQPPAADEVSMLVRARKLLQTQPERALALTTQHSEAFPNGVFAEERELLASEALLRLGRYEQLNQRIARFLATYPSSAHRTRVEALRGRE